MPGSSGKGTGFFLPRGYAERSAAKPAGGASSSSSSSISPTKSRVSSTTDSQPRHKGGVGQQQQQHIPAQEPGLSRGLGAGPPPPPPPPRSGQGRSPAAPVCQPPPPPPPPRSSVSPPGSSGVLPRVPAVADASHDGCRPSESWVEGDSWAAPRGALPTQPLTQPQLHNPVARATAAGGDADSAPLLTYIPTATGGGLAGASPAAPIAFRSSTLLTTVNHSVGSLGQLYQPGSSLTGVGSGLTGGVQLVAAAGTRDQLTASSPVPQQQQQPQLWPAGLLEPRPSAAVQSAPVPKLGSPFVALQHQQQQQVQLQLQVPQQQQQQQDADVMLLRPLSPGDAISAELAASTGDLEQTLASLQLRLAAARLAAGGADLDAPVTLGGWDHHQQQQQQQQQQQLGVSPMLSPSTTTPIDIAAALAGQHSAPVAGLGLSLGGHSLAASPVILGGSFPTASTMASAFDSGSLFAACAEWDSLDQNAVFLGDRASSCGPAGLRQSSVASLGGSDLGRTSVSAAAAAAAGSSWLSAGPSGEVFDGSLQLQDLSMQGAAGGVAGGLGGAAGQGQQQQQQQQQADVGVLAAAAAQQKLQQMAALEALQNQLRQDVVGLLHLI